MPSPLFTRFQGRKRAAANKAKALAKRLSQSRAARETRQAVKSGKKSARQLVEAGLKKLGKVGSVLKALLSFAGVPMEEAAEVVNQAVKETVKAPPKPIPPPVRKPEPRRGRPEAPAEVEDVRLVPPKSPYEDSDPILTGEMIDVQSSNVHSIGFDYNWDNPSKSTLKVRFLQGKKDAKHPGPLYFYYDVRPQVFEAFRKAISKGKFVWDELRIRGTVTGHQYRYQLAGISRGYVPRQAKKYGPNQYFVRRQFQGVRGGQSRDFESELPDQRVGTYRPANRGTPNRGRPKRGS